MPYFDINISLKEINELDIFTADIESILHLKIVLKGWDLKFFEA